MGSIRLAMIYGVLGILFIGTATVNAQESTELPQFKSGASINIGLAADFKVLDQRVNAIYDVVESDSSHIVWKFAGTTGDMAFIFADGRVLVASTAGFDLAAKDMLAKELNDALDMLNAVNPGLISSETRNNALESTIYYASEEGIYHRLKHDFNSDFELTLSVPECTIKKARLTVTGEDGWSRVDLGGGLVGPGNLGQGYSIDDKEITGCSTNGAGSCYAPSTEITDQLTLGLHKLNAYRIDNEHTLIIEAITSSKPTKSFILYGPNYVPWINETSESKTMNDMHMLITSNTPTINTISDTN